MRGPGGKRSVDAEREQPKFGRRAKAEAEKKKPPDYFTLTPLKSLVGPFSSSTFPSLPESLEISRYFIFTFIFVFPHPLRLET
jgi:hypothetical protein